MNGRARADGTDTYPTRTFIPLGPRIVKRRKHLYRAVYVRVYVRVHARFSVRIYAGLSCMEFCIENVYSKKTCYVFLNWICPFHFGKMKVVLPKEKGI